MRHSSFRGLLPADNVLLICAYSFECCSQGFVGGGGGGGVWRRILIGGISGGDGRRNITDDANCAHFLCTALLCETTSAINGFGALASAVLV